MPADINNTLNNPENQSPAGYNNDIPSPDSDPGVSNARALALGAKTIQLIRIYRNSGEIPKLSMDFSDEELLFAENRLSIWAIVFDVSQTKEEFIELMSHLMHNKP